MKNKKITAILTILFLSFALTACSSGKVDVSQESSSEFDTSEEKEEETEESESSEEETETTKEEETTKESENKVEESKTEESIEEKKETKESKTSESSKQSTPKQEETKPAETTPAPHTHSYSSSITKNPTCSEMGIKTFICDGCKDSYTENIPTTEHSWQPQYSIVQHEAKGEIRQTQVQVGTSGEVHTCMVCNAEFGSASEFVDHCKSFVDTDRGHATARSLIRDGEPIYEYQNEWVVTEEAWTENVLTGYICTTCGISQ